MTRGLRPGVELSASPAAVRSRALRERRRAAREPYVFRGACVVCLGGLMACRSDALYCSKRCSDKAFRAAHAQHIRERKRRAYRDARVPQPVVVCAKCPGVARFRSRYCSRTCWMSDYDAAAYNREKYRADVEYHRRRSRIRTWGDPTLADAAYAVHQLKKEASSYGNR